ncbi:MAG: undecaprenyldiphospho-muramoylpentapeptide beta-N-acetylglucosaminyltransferase [Bacteroidota bacterium]|nr:undecaprenyldiphospho-muramoylpentapeptide beta-N-acetylglucosaminyltransferase [Bacteroidota bacterium]
MLNKVIISGGGTGGHIFPALAIAEEIKRRYPNCDILFVGAIGRMEMEKVPLAGFHIVGLPIIGIQRAITIQNLYVPFKLLSSLIKAQKIIKEFNPQVVIGVGGYASAATLYMAARKRIPCLIQEQNSFAGLTNKLLGKIVTKICVAYPSMERFFPSHKIYLTGNPVRKEILQLEQYNQAEEKEKLGFNKEMPLVLVLGGSLGARSINNSIQAKLNSFDENNIQVLWQTGKNFMPNTEGYKHIKAMPFIFDMASVYAAADIIVSRAGALSISELSLVGKPVILVPSPNVSEDHQTKNAMALVDKKAAVLVKDNQASSQLVETVLDLIKNEDEKNILSQNVLTFGKKEAVIEIVNHIESIIH